MSEFVHLHVHSEYSPMDGLSTVDQIVEQAVANGQTAVAVTDHGYCSGHPSFASACEKAGIKPIFGIEAYFVDDRTRKGLPKPEFTDQPDGVYEEQLHHWEIESKARRDYYHLTLWAKNDEGLRNLYAMSTESYNTGMYYKPRIDWQLLEQYHEGLMASTACLRGPIAHPILRYNNLDRAVSNLMRLQSIFGDDLFLEVHANGMQEQVSINQITMDLGKRHKVPLIAVADSHFPSQEDHGDHQAWIAVQTNTDVQDETDLFAHSENLYMQSEQEVRDVLLGHLPSDAVDDCIANTAVVAGRAGGSLVSPQRTPIYSKVGGHRPVRARVQILVDKLFCGYFLYVWDYVKYAKDHGVLVGPGRGSGAGSLVAYLLGITEVDPVEADLLFERFMTEGRTSLPDFDVDFPATKRDFMQDYVTGKYGRDHVVRVGTHLRLKNKGIIKDLFRALKSQIDVDPQEVFADSAAISQVITEAEAGTAGLGLSWEELWAQEGDLLDPYAEKYPLVFEKAGKLVGRLKSYGKHAAGLVISVEEP
jgi:DNA polymerase-3 subunit alpha